MLSCLLFLTSAGCSDKTSDKINSGSKQSMAERSEPIVVKIEYTDIPNEIRAVGVLKAFQEVEISSEISGKIIKIHHDVGDKVVQGAVLAEIDNESRKIALEIKRSLLRKAEAARAKAQKDSGKSAKLFKEGVISDSESDTTLLEQQLADAELSLARSEVMSAEKDLRDTQIKTPFSGMIALKNVALGKLVSPGQNIFTLVDIHKIKIEVQVSELDIDQISINNRAAVVLESLKGETFEGRVATIGLKADDSTRSFPVEIIVDNPQERLLPGMIAAITIVSDTPKKLILVPPKAVHALSNTKVVYVMENNIPVKRVIQASGTLNDLLIVEKGLSQGEWLITSEISSTK